MNNGTVVGVEPEDTIASYKTLDGRTLVTPSNRVHIYSPRFMAVRQVIGVQQSDQLARTAGVYRPDRLSLGERTQITANAKQNVQTEGEIGRKLLTTYRSRQGDGASRRPSDPKASRTASWRLRTSRFFAPGRTNRARWLGSREARPRQLPGRKSNRCR